MSGAKFTKGEWFIEKDENYWNDDCWAISVKRDYDGSVHHCFAEVTYKMEHEDCNPELEANAHLIAAAPKMYNAAQALIDFVIGKYGLSGVDELTCPHMKLLAESLAEARGEQC